ncbi:MAG: hypothetical protein KatS3mg040_0317 [Candidatus Kapaibacterium sp.]|nr:MAG: hypothetical protein KatS3mg040_0317 [Candidatus Kapabacteria bacterium]
MAAAAKQPTSSTAYPQPTVTVTPSPAGPVCEGTSVTFTINVTPSSVTSGSFSFTLNTTSLTDISVTPGAGVATLSGSGATYSGTFNAATFSVVVNPGTVTAAYDALGSISLTVNSLTSGPSSLSCGISSPVTSAPVTITQLPDLVNVATGSYNPGGNPTIPTLAVASPPAPATLIPVNNIPSANTITSTTACTWDNTDGYAQEYRYAIQEIHRRRCRMTMIRTNGCLHFPLALV